MAKKSTKRDRHMPIMRPHAAGMDIGAERIYVAIPGTTMTIQCVALVRLHATCAHWVIGCSSVASTRYRWSRPVLTGSPSFRSWNREGSTSFL
jgi:hypothetical protein